MSTATHTQAVLTSWNQLYASPPLAPLAPGGTLSSGVMNLKGYDRIMGAVQSNQLAAAIAVAIQFRAVGGGPIIVQFNVTAADPSSPANTYIWNVPVQLPYVEIVFTNGAVAATLLRAFNEALPI